VQSKPPSKRVDILITLAGLAGIFLALAFYNQAFPEAALELKLSRQEITSLAQQTMQSYGYEVQDYKSALEFASDDWASIYLQRTLGIPETNSLIRQENLPIWYWHARWFIPLQKEEFSLYLSPDGQVVNFSHTIEEDAPGAAITVDEARALAEAYLVNQQGLNLSQWEPVTSSSTDRPGGRRDHYYEWKKRDFEVGESELKISASVHGDKMDGYNYWLKVPEDFTRQFEETSDKASFIDSLSTLLGVGGFSIAAIVVFGLSLLRHGRPRRSAYFVALLVGIVSALAGLNSLPLYKISYDTTQSYPLFWFQILFYGLIGLLMLMAYMFVLWAGGERISRLVWPRQDRVLPLAGDRWIVLARSTWRGLMLAGVLGGYVVIFYLVATRLFGGWAPVSPDYSDVYATPFPFLIAIASGVLPAIDEETTFRLIGIALLLGLTRRRWLALFVPGALWALAHLTYVRDPFYLRGIELVIPAVFLFGLAFLRFDLITAIILHMTYNASLAALPMLRSGEPYFVLSGVIVLLFLISPMLPGLWHAARRRRLRAAQPSEPQVALASPYDLPGLAGLPLGDIDWQKLLDDPDAVVCCLKLGEQVIGASSGRLQGEIGQLETIYVEPSWREQYYGSALVDALCDELRARHAASIQVAVPTEDRLALTFLYGQGWQPQTQVFTHGVWPTLPALFKAAWPGKK
jgi:ribosomal protein S18 acetylase RimI-like enzyme